MGIVGWVGLNTVAFWPWNRTARSPAHNLLTDSSGTLISLKRCASFAMGGRPGALSWSVAMDAMMVSFAVCAMIASCGLRWG